jgi:hypothetical protein
MKTAILSLFLLLTTFCLYGQSQPPVLVLTSHDVDHYSVRVTTAPQGSIQNMVFRFTGKTPAEIKAIFASQPQVKIMCNGALIALTKRGAYAGLVDSQKNFIGMVLIFKKYAEAKSVEQALRGN